jgi:hypothetical protein
MREGAPMMPPSQAFKSFLENTAVHRDIERGIARAVASMDDSVKRTTETIEQSRDLLAKLAKIRQYGR